jgi:endonuclease III
LECIGLLALKSLVAELLQQVTRKSWCQMSGSTVECGREICDTADGWSAPEVKFAELFTCRLQQVVEDFHQTLIRDFVSLLHLEPVGKRTLDALQRL